MVGCVAVASISIVIGIASDAHRGVGSAQKPPLKNFLGKNPAPHPPRKISGR